jgi:hypothetical protein
VPNKPILSFQIRLLTPALSSFGEERENNFVGRLTQGGADFVSLALGYHLSGFQPCESVCIGVHPWLKLFCPERAL